MNPVTTATPLATNALTTCPRCRAGFWREDDGWSCYQCGFFVNGESRQPSQAKVASRPYRSNITGRVLDYLVETGQHGATMDNIVEKLNLSSPSVDNALRRLRAALLISRSDFKPTAGGHARWWATRSQAVAS